jgi:hypothetical protein
MRIEFHDRGFQELLTSAATKAEVKGHADTMAARANATPSTTEPAATEPYYEVQDGTDEKRARYRVRTASERAAKHEAKTQALQRNI